MKYSRASSKQRSKAGWLAGWLGKSRKRQPEDRSRQESLTDLFSTPEISHVKSKQESGESSGPEASHVRSKQEQQTGAALSPPLSPRYNFRSQDSQH
ncbi:hypothetical protein Pmani_029698 [Petrolisthes manimaculis]|uniref:Uncharacterized protein n=1 Tax=Petrolisthes manimaculis TaxID=1843537 RepID=A0AAE1NX36_9EUCA|nr:hypothetical protein Pmani_029698 [Petrolisthes manimaculis]